MKSLSFVRSGVLVGSLKLFQDTVQVVAQPSCLLQTQRKTERTKTAVGLRPKRQKYDLSRFRSLGICEDGRFDSQQLNNR